MSKNPGNVAGGLKGTLHRDDVCEEAKQNAQRRLDEMGVGTDELSSDAPSRSKATIEDDNAGENKDETRVLAGYKATIKNPRVSDEAKEHARQYVEEHNAGETKDETRVLAGYKATVKNPRVSDEAKEHARQYVEEHSTD